MKFELKFDISIGASQVAHRAKVYHNGELVKSIVSKPGVSEPALAVENAALDYIEERVEAGDCEFDEFEYDVEEVVEDEFDGVTEEQILSRYPN